MAGPQALAQLARPWPLRPAAIGGAPGSAARTGSRRRCARSGTAARRYHRGGL